MSSAYLGYLSCPRCGARADEADAFTRCRSCADDGVAVNPLPAYDQDRVAAATPQDDQPGIFRHRSLLPLHNATPAVSLQEGRTPLIPIERLGAQLGAPRLWIKDESRNPTWSYKDRLAAVAVTKAREVGTDTVVVSSTGNHGAAVAAYAAAAGLRCVALTVATVPLTMKVLMQAYGASVAACRTGPERWTVMAEAVEQRGWMPMSGFHDPPSGSNPFGVDGYKTIAYELAEQLPAIPDVVVVPAAYGDGLAGILRGFEDLVLQGRASQVPRLVAAEPLGPYADALERGLETSGRVPGGPSVAFSTATPIGTYQGLHALRRSGGTAVPVPDDDEVLDAQSLAARTEGLYLEAASALALAVVRRLVVDGAVGREERVVVIGTSTGLKDIGATATRLPAVPVIDPTLDALDEALAA